MRLPGERALNWRGRRDDKLVGGVSVSGWSESFVVFCREGVLMAMESFILVAAVVAWLGGTLILLTCLAARRAELVEAYNIDEAVGGCELVVEGIDDADEQPVTVYAAEEEVAGG